MDPSETKSHRLPYRKDSLDLPAHPQSVFIESRVPLRTAAGGMMIVAETARWAVPVIGDWGMGGDCGYRTGSIEPEYS